VNLVAVFDWLMPFVLLLGVLVFIHELGHFAVAKWLGVKVEKFSIGFGPSLLARRYGETEYVIAALPLGGFVKMLGEIPGEELDPAEASRAFNTRPIWQRIAIALAGPAMNLVLPVFLIAAILMSGVPTLTSRVGGVVPGSVADQAGLREGDRVTAVNGEPLWRWSDLEDKLAAPGPAQVSLRVERAGQADLELALPREKADGGGWKDTGFSYRAPVARVGVPDADSPAALAGIETGDRIAAVGGEPVDNLYALERVLATAKVPLELQVARAQDGESQIVRVAVRELDAKPSLEALGLVPIGVTLVSVEPTSPAKRAGLEAKDVVLRAGDQLATGPDELRQVILGSGGKTVSLRVLRGDRLVDLDVTPVERPTKTATGTELHFGIGVALGSDDVGAEYKDEIVRNPFVAVARGAERTADIFKMIVGGIVQVLSGAVGMNNLSGPIGIGEIAADAYQTSWTQFVWLMAVISVNLAILNLLPIPVLDGGQIALAAAEGIKGSPLPARARDVAQTVGLSLILLLMGVAFWNDIARHWSGVVSFLSDKLG
jgi:regulator of sigma E protease